MSWKAVRIVLLLAVLAIVASDAWFERQRAVTWRATIRVALQPFADDDSTVTRDYVAGLGPLAFAPVETFLRASAGSHGLPLTEPVRIELEPVLASPPPPPPADPGPLGALWWQLRMRLYAARIGRGVAGPRPHVRLFVLYHDPAQSPRVPHSLALRKGQLGLVHAFASADMNGSNDVVIAHELLHVFGATDKYDPVTNAPRFPEGYGEPGLVPRYPQRLAEIMAGRRAVSATKFETPESLDDCIVGAATAVEIHWPQRASPLPGVAAVRPGTWLQVAPAQREAP